jgi:SAM-dependent methyltransferase
MQHLPYEIDEQADRFHYYETLWKRRGLELLLRHCKPSGKTLLDYGCGRGEVLELARQAGFQVLGADVDPTCVELASRFGPARQLNSTDPIAQFDAKSFDVVACFHVLEHVENPKQVLLGLGKISKEYVVLAVPNLRYLHHTFERKFDLREVNAGHLQSWDHWHLLNLAERHCGLKLVEWGSDATILPFSNIAARLLGMKALIRLETGLFRKLFPFHGVSILGLFKPIA